MSQIKSWILSPPRTHQVEITRLVVVLESVAPALLYGARIWAGVCLALYAAFWLQLDNPYWAGVTVAIVCQPSLGASLRKARFYVVGTVVGAVAVVALTAFFPQDRLGFLIGLALWSAACGFVATMLRNFAAFAAALAGYTATLIASGELGATGGASQAVFLLAVNRASDICVGIVSATIVLSWTDFGGANSRLSGQLAAVSADIAGGIAGAFTLCGLGLPAKPPISHDLAGRVGALDRAIDDAVGESSSLRLHSPILHGAVGGLFAALSGWRMAALQLEQLPTDDRQREAIKIQCLLRTELKSDESTGFAVNPLRARQACVAAVRKLAALEYRTPSLRLLADQTAEALIGVRRAFDGLVLLADPFRTIHGRSTSRFFYAPDWLPCLVNSGRILLTIGTVEVFWVATAWPSGALAFNFAAIYVLLFTLQGDQARSTAADFLIGVGLTAAAAATVKFAVLPQVETFTGFSLAIGLVLAPAGAAIALRWRPAIFTFVTIFFVLLLGAENQMTYDTEQLYNLALAMFVGLGSAALAFHLLPPLSPALRARRLLAFTLRDVRRLTKRPAAWTANDWKRRMYGRLCALPAPAEPERAQLLTALSTGTEIIRLRRMVRQFHLQGQVDTALQAMARGDRSDAMEQLTRLDGMLVALPGVAPEARDRLRARGSVLAISEALAQPTLFLDLEHAP